MSFIQNVTGIEFIDIPVQLLTNTGVGSMELAAFTTIALAVLVLLVTDSRKELLLLIPTPLIVVITNNTSSGLSWLKVVVFLIMGVYTISIIESAFKIEK